MTLLQKKIHSNINNERKAVTRTKIQLGGLLVKSKLADLVGIIPGEDLQLDAEKWDQAALLLGLLNETYERDQSLSLEEKDHLIQKGTLSLKYDFFPGRDL